MTTSATSEPVRTALFLDFDNLYSGLQAEPRMHGAFCRRPGVWLSRFEEGWGAPDAGRRILVARAYLNPTAHSAHRRPLTLAGFEVVDTPSLTSAGKSAADIRMAIDILDALASPVHYEEFIILSGDADFTPIFHRLRANDRRTMIVSSLPVASAYRRVADTVVDRVVLSELLGADAARAAEVTAPAAAPVAEAAAPAAAPVAEAAAPAAADSCPGERETAILAALATVLESGGAGQDGLVAAVLGAGAAAGHVLDADAVGEVLSTFEQAGLPVVRVAEPTVSAIRRALDAIRAEPGQVAA